MIIVFKAVGNHWTLNEMNLMFFIPMWVNWTIYFTWLFFIGKALKHIVNNCNFRQFRNKMIIAYIAFCSNFIPIDQSIFDIPQLFSVIPSIIFLFGFFSTLGWIIIHLFKIEEKGKPKFGDYVENGFLLFFYPIGIWNIQKRIKKYL
jgi:hypothetical protein